MIKKIFYIFLGFFILFYTIYYRVFIIRMPKNLFLFDNFNYNVIFIVIMGFCTSTLLLYKSITLLLNNNKENFITHLFKKVNIIIDDVMYETYDFCQSRIKNSYDKCSNFVENFYSFFGYKHEGILILIPNIIRCIILTSFLLDIFVFFKLKYFYFMLYLLIINLVIKLIIFVLKDFASNLEDIKSDLIITTTIDEKENTYKIIIEPNKVNIDLNYTVNAYKICNKISGYLEAYDFYDKDYSRRFNIVIYSLYLIGWSYVLIKNMFLINTFIRLF